MNALLEVFGSKPKSAIVYLAQFLIQLCFVLTLWNNHREVAIAISIAAGFSLLALFFVFFDALASFITAGVYSFFIGFASLLVLINLNFLATLVTLVPLGISVIGLICKPQKIKQPWLILGVVIGLILFMLGLLIFAYTPYNGL